MPQFSTTSRRRLETCNPDLQRLFRHVVADYDCSILVGHRGQMEQDLAVREGRSQLAWPNSKHNSNPSMAVDVAPYPIDWGETGDARHRAKAISRFYHFAGYVLATAKHMVIPIRWGGDWDGDGDFADQRFDDLVHWEIT